MRGLSVRQPWAWYILHGGKRIENRSRRTRYRGPVLIHASRRCTFADWRAAALFVGGFAPELVERCPPPGDLPTGAVVGIARLDDVIEPRTVAGAPDPATRVPDVAMLDWYTGDFGWVLADVQPLDAPIAHRGNVVLWHVPDGLRDAALRGAIRQAESRAGGARS